MFSCEYSKVFNNSFFYRKPPVAASADVLFYTIFLKNVSECIVVIHCIIVWFWNLKSLSFALIRCATRCHLLYHSLSFFVTRCYSLSFIVTRCHLLSLVVICCHSLPLVVHSLSLLVPLAVIHCTTHCYLLSLAIILCHLLYHSLYHSPAFLLLLSIVIFESLPFNWCCFLLRY